MERDIEVLNADRFVDVFGTRPNREIDRALMLGQIFLTRSDELLSRLLRVVLELKEDHVGELWLGCSADLPPGRRSP